MTEFEFSFRHFLRAVMDQGQEVEVGQWQSQDVRDNPDMISRELLHQQFRLEIPGDMKDLQSLVKPNLPWAEDHFQERVSGYPLNPPPSESYWPYARKANAEHKVSEKFHHTYPERMWPKEAQLRNEYGITFRMRGIRYAYGDLMDIVKQLKKNPLTRQAYLPIWFPEDTGACGVEGQRVPCTLGYQFICRRGKMDIVYHIRSCDLLRHFTDDVYMAARLLQWMIQALTPDRYYEPGMLVMNITSLHIFRGDYYKVRTMLDEWDDDGYGAAI